MYLKHIEYDNLLLANLESIKSYITYYWFSVKFRHAAVTLKTSFSAHTYVIIEQTLLTFIHLNVK